MKKGDDVVKLRTGKIWGLGIFLVLMLALFIFFFILMIELYAENRNVGMIILVGFLDLVFIALLPKYFAMMFNPSRFYVRFTPNELVIGGLLGPRVARWKNIGHVEVRNYSFYERGVRVHNKNLTLEILNYDDYIDHLPRHSRAWEFLNGLLEFSVFRRDKNFIYINANFLKTDPGKLAARIERCAKKSRKSTATHSTARKARR
jgi:hypothetical protein